MILRVDGEKINLSPFFDLFRARLFALQRAGGKRQDLTPRFLRGRQNRACATIAKSNGPYLLSTTIEWALLLGFGALRRAWKSISSQAPLTFFVHMTNSQQCISF